MRRRNTLNMAPPVGDQDFDFGDARRSGRHGLFLYQYGGITFRLVEFYRSHLNDLGTYIPADRRGVYAIENPRDCEVYIGQGDLLSRLFQHGRGQQQRDFWTKGIAFFSSDSEEITMEVSQKLEHWLISCVRSEWTVHNKNAGHASLVPGPSAGTVRIAQQMLRSSLAVPDGWFLEGTSNHVRTPPSHHHERRSTLPDNVRSLVTVQDFLKTGGRFQVNKSYGLVTGFLCDRNGKTSVLIKAGSAFDKRKDSLSSHYVQQRQKLASEGVIDLRQRRFLRDHVFVTASSAATFLNGFNTNGNLFFKLKADTPFDEVASA